MSHLFNYLSNRVISIQSSLVFFVMILVISDLLTTKYGKLFAESARTTTGDHNVSEKLMHKLAIQAPPKLLVEKYLVEIAAIYKIDYEPDPQVMKEEEQNSKLFYVNFLV